MHPFAHLLVGALIGAAARTPAGALAGGIFSHYALDVIPHTEEETFTGPEVERARTGLRLGPGLVEAGLEAVLGVLAVGWLLSRCREMDPWSVGLGALGGLLPDLVDAPIKMFLGTGLVHPSRLHWTVTRRYAVWGILTQVAVAGGTAMLLWRVGGCG